MHNACHGRLTTDHGKRCAQKREAHHCGVAFQHSFSVVHRPRTNGFSVQFIELLLFALVLGFVFCLTHDLLAVITIHFLRNFLVGIKGQAHEG